MLNESRTRASDIASWISSTFAASARNSSGETDSNNASPLELGRIRKQYIRKLLSTNPVTIKQTLRLGIFNQYSSGARWFNVQGKKSRGWKPKCIGIVNKELARPSNVYCDFRPRHLEHEIALTEELIDWPIEITDIKRCIMTNSELKPDAQFQNLM